MTEQQNFKEQVRSSIIPTLESMVEKERDHLQYLLKVKERLSMPLADKFIDMSKNYLHHYETRLEEYKQYAKRRETQS